jgi:glycosyltransferase involved in cell wall biosynthesis
MCYDAVDFPVVSIIMNVYNSEKFINATIDSILKQTMKEFEFIIIDDGSTDRTGEIIENYSDKRIIFIKNEQNLGIPKSANIGLKIARGQYIARIDADDICNPNRFEVQVKYLKEHPDISLISCYMSTFGLTKFMIKPPICHEKIRVYLLFNSVLMHPGFMMRRSDIEEINLKYDENFKYALDYEFQTRASYQLKLANITDVLIKYRIHDSQVSTSKKNEQAFYANKVRDYQLKKLGIVLKEKYLSMYGNALIKQDKLTMEEWKLIHFVFHLIVFKNSEKKIYDSVILTEKIQQVYWSMLARETFFAKKSYIKACFSPDFHGQDV